MTAAIPRVAAFGAALVLAAGGDVAGAAPTTAARVVYRISDPRITEASGIAAGRVSPGIDYVQNDSGDRNRFFALDARTGATAATVTVTGAVNVDWEDIAVAPDSAGVSSVWLADIGDDDAVRREVRLYRVAEPRIARTDHDVTVRTARAAVWRLRYPGGPVDAESLAVTPQGTAYLITKSLLGASVVYRVPSRPDRGQVQVLERVGRIGFVPTGTPNPFGIIGQLTATGAAISSDGDTLAVRTYADAYFWPLAHGDVRAALTRAPTRVALPRQPQGEGIAVTPDSVLVDSEGVHGTVYALPRARLRAAPAGRPSRPSGRLPAPVSSPALSAPRPGDDGNRPWLVAGSVLAAGLLIIAIWSWRGRIRACRSPRSTAR